MDVLPIMHYGMVTSSRGDCYIIATDKGICWTGTPGTPLAAGKEFVRQKIGDCRFEEGGSEILDRARYELGEYLSGKGSSFSIRFDLHGTEFQKAVWLAIFNIPYGKTMSYKDLARKVGRPLSFRAVANACGANPVAVIIPCHRVVGSGGYLGGYGGGLATKQSLLSMEHLHLT